MATASLRAVTNELRRRKGNIPTLGIQSCRAKNINGVLRPDKGYSEHAYGNAEDLKIIGYNAQKPYVDELAKMKAQGFPVGLVLWAGVRADHTDHIHVEGSPSLSKPGRRPPCAGGNPIDSSGSGVVVSVGTGAGAGAGASKGFAPITLPLVGELGVSWGQIIFVVIGLGVGVAVIAFLMSGFTAKAIEKSGVGQLAEAVIK